MDLQDKMNSLQVNIELVETELELTRGQVEKLEEHYVSAKKKFEEDLKGQPLDFGRYLDQDTGVCSQNVTPETRHLTEEMRERLAQRDELLAQVENLQAKRDNETIHHLQMHRKLLEILIQCERHKKELFKNLYRDNVADCQSFIQSLYRSIGEDMEPFKHSLSPQELNLLGRRKSWSRCWRNGLDVRNSSPEIQQRVSDLLSMLERLESVLESERLETEKGKQMYLILLHECEKLSHKIKQRKTSCTCGPNVPPDLHTSECEIRFTQDDEGLLEVLDECVVEIMDNVAEVENQAEEQLEVFTWEVRQEAAANQWGCMMICAQRNNDDNDLQSKLKSLEAQLKYERDRAEKFEQLYLIVGGKIDNLMKVEMETQQAESENLLVKSEAEMVKSENQFVESEPQPVESENQLVSQLVQLEDQFVDWENQFVKSEDDQFVDWETQFVNSEAELVELEDQFVESEKQFVKSEAQLVESENQSVETENQLMESENKLVETENQLVETENQSKEETDVRQEQGPREKVMLQSSNIPLLAESETLSMNKDKPAETRIPGTVQEKKEVDMSHKRTSDTPESLPPAQQTKSRSGYLFSKLVKGVCVYVAVGVGFTILVPALLYLLYLQ